MELGGCCLTRYGALPSKADRIMSRYRPIAPKPTCFSGTSIPDVNRTVSTVGSLDTAVSRPIVDAGKSRRIRKRRGDPLSSPQPSKKAASTSGRSDSSKEQSSVSNCAASSVFIGPPFAEIARTSVDRFSGGCVFGANALKSSMGIALADPSEASVLGGACVVASVHAVGTPGLFIDSEQNVLQDAGFTKRAAASIPPSVLSDGVVTTLCSGRFTEMIRGITRASVSKDILNFTQPLGSSVQTMRNISTDSRRESFDVALAPSFRSDLLDVEDKKNAEHQQQLQHDDDCIGNLVTLPLLRDPHSHSGSSHSSISIGSSLTQANDLKKSHADVLRDVSFRFLRDEPHTCSSHEHEHPKSSHCDIALIRQIYGTSQEPVLLMGDGRDILWCNTAYERAFKSSMDRQAGKNPRVVPFIDPLGVPTQLGKFKLHFPVRGCSSATLWGFLKKFVLDAETEAPGVSSASEFPLEELNLYSFPDVCCRLGDGSASLKKDVSPGSSEREASCKSGVIVPQPVRLVGSTVRLESVTDVQTEAELVSENLEVVKKQLEEGNSPAFITDSGSKVRWVNTAYKQMIGQPECPWLVSTINAVGKTSLLPSPRLTGEVLFTSVVEIPLSAPAFSGRANIQWMNTGERNCMTVPCDVCRLDANAMMLVWKFDIDASLRLTCGR